MTRLLGLIRDHPAALEADLVRFAGAPTDLDLAAACSVHPWKVSLSWLLRRTRHIPHGQGAAIHTIDGPEWSITDDLLDTLRRWYISAHTESHDDPGPHPRHPAAQSGDEAPTDDVVAHVAALKAQREAAIAAGEI